MQRYLTKALLSNHNRASFSCGKPQLDYYIQKQARQDMKRQLCVVFVMLAENSTDITGYYTLSSHSIQRSIVPDAVIKHMPTTYTHLPVTLLGRLAVSSQYQGKKLGQRLLLDALRRSYDIASTELGSMAVVVDPIDENAVCFYQQYGFIPLPDCNRLFLPMKTIKQLF